MYPSKTFKIPRYGWTIELYEASLQELDELRATIKDNDAFGSALFRFVKTWDCKDKNGNDIPCEAGNLRKLPQSVVQFIIKAVSDPFMDDDPKNA